MADVAGWAAWRFRGSRRRDVLRNQLALCGGDRRRAKAATRRVFTAIARYYVDLATIGYRDMRTFERDHIRFTGEDRLRVLDEGPVIALSAHMGSPELGVQTFIGRGKRFVALVEPLEPRWLGEELNRLREAGGGRYVAADGRGIRVSLQTLRRGGIVAMLGDRDIQGGGVCIDLLGRRVRLPQGPFVMAQRTGATILPVFARRETAERLVLHVEEPFGVEAGDDPAKEIAEAVQRWARLLERHLREVPEQWTVTEDFWQVHSCG